MRIDQTGHDRLTIHIDNLRISPREGSHLVPLSRADNDAIANNKRLLRLSASVKDVDATVDVYLRAMI